MSKSHKKPEGVPKYRGVTWDSRNGKWRCYLTVGGQNLYLGSHSDPYIAACVYDRYKMEVVEAGWAFQSKSQTNAELGLIPHLTLEELRRIVPPTPESLWWIAPPTL